ncbi:MAG TPA: NAD(P)H-dependent oxidoreductase subunit E [Dehalococcoidia bacterium]|jgi:NADH:ubiquinone oxidoreductase subunit E|nr:NAD(P)H-dependent oxidoreductase subunit E [Dehalococcoidia bacterium]
MSGEIPESELDAMRAAVDALPRRRDQLLPALLAAEHALGWLPEPAIEHVANHTRIPLSEVYATATAYSELRLEAPIEGQWHVCTGVACRQAGADALIEALGERAAPIDCRFLCALAPVAEDGDGALHGRCARERLVGLASAGAAS